MKRIIVLILFAVIGFLGSNAQPLVGASPSYVEDLTSNWRGERFEDGRPKVSDIILERLSQCTLEQIWDYLRVHGYSHQIETSWLVLHPQNTMVGRVLTTQFMPSRPDLDSSIMKQARKEGRSEGPHYNTWPIADLQKGDIWVADAFGKIKDAALIGSSFGSAVFGRSHNGVIFNGAVRDMQELKDIEGFNFWVKGQDPSFIRDMMPISINAPIRIGQVSVLPGDVVFANAYGVAFIPAFLVEGLVSASEWRSLRDEYERYLLQRAEYPAPVVHGNWTENIKNEFRSWIKKYPKKVYLSNDEMELHLKMNDH